MRGNRLIRQVHAVRTHGARRHVGGQQLGQVDSEALCVLIGRLGVGSSRRRGLDEEADRRRVDGGCARAVDATGHAAEQYGDDDEPPALA